MTGSATERKPLADDPPTNPRPRVAGAAPSIPESADRPPVPCRPPESRPSWDDAVFAVANALPAGAGVAGSTLALVLLRWAHYASWSGGRPGINGYPSAERLAAETPGVSNEKTARRCLDLAVELGLLAKTAGRRGGRDPRPAVYAARVPAVVVPEQSGHLEVRSAPEQTGEQSGHLEVRSASSASARAGRQSGHGARAERTWSAGRADTQMSGNPIDPKTPTPSARDDVASPLVQLLNGGGGGHDEDEQTDATAAAADVVEELAVVLRLGDLDRAQLVPAIATALDAGRWPAPALVRELTRDLPPDVRAPRHFLGRRLANLPPPPAATRPVAPARPWCGSCDSDGYRYRVDDDGRPLGKCECHPGYAAAASA